MNKQPVIYYQTDSRWKNNDYSAKGEKTTIGASGCGPTSMAMVLATLCDKSITPATECAWALKNGYKCAHSGTYYSYFVPAGKRYGLTVKQLNSANIYGNSTASYHATAKNAIDNGNLVIACMGKGTWTSSGHYVLVWKISGNVIYINDPASSKLARTQGNYTTFKKQVKYYWTIQVPKSTTTTITTTNTKPATTTTTTTTNNSQTMLEIMGVEKPKENELDMTKEEFLKSLTNEEAYDIISKARAHTKDIPQSDWSKTEGSWDEAIEADIVDGTRPTWFITREECIAILRRVMGKLTKHE